jgi:hypothetical protein
MIDLVQSNIATVLLFIHLPWPTFFTPLQPPTNRS